MEAIVTSHAAKRAKERAGIPKSAIDKNANKALRLGIQHKDTGGSLKRYFDYLYFKNKTANNIRIYCGNVYIFCDAKLITMFPLPQKYRNTAQNIARRNNGEK